LRPKRTYAFVVLRALGDGAGAQLGVDATMRDLAAGKAPAALQALYDPLYQTLDTIKIARADVAAATVFTTADVVEDLFDISTALLAKYSVTIDGLHVDPDDGAQHPRFCELVGTVTMPQFQ